MTEASPIVPPPATTAELRRMAPPRAATLIDGLAQHKGASILIASLGYFLLSRGALLLSSYTQEVAVIWPAAGFGFAAAWLFGRWMLPGVLLAEFASALFINDVELSMLLATGNALAVASAVEFTRALKGEGRLFDKARNALAFLVGGAVTLSAVASAAGVASLLRAGVLTVDSVWTIWWVWFLSDVTGVLVVAPPCIALLRGQASPLRRGAAWERLVMILVIAALVWQVFGVRHMHTLSTYPLAFLFAPALLWAAFRFGHRTLFTGVAVIAAAALYGTALGHGPFGAQSFPQNFLLLQVFIIFLAGTTLVTHAAVAERSVTMRTLQLTQDMTVLSLASLAEMRDTEADRTTLRNQGYVRVLAEHLRENTRWRSQLTRETIDLMSRAAPLHDVGKVGVPDSILRKPGPLTPEERACAQSHVSMATKALMNASDAMNRASLMQMAETMAATHHERWDGAGYPRGLAGEDIPLAGRIMAVADVYDALTSRRAWREAFTHDEACATIFAGSGTQFDPEVVDAFLANAEAFRKLSTEDGLPAESTETEQAHETALPNAAATKESAEQEEATNTAARRRSNTSSRRPA